MARYMATVIRTMTADSALIMYMHDNGLLASNKSTVGAALIAQHGGPSWCLHIQRISTSLREDPAGAREQINHMASCSAQLVFHFQTSPQLTHKEKYVRCLKPLA